MNLDPRALGETLGAGFGQLVEGDDVDEEGRCVARAVDGEA